MDYGFGCIVYEKFESIISYILCKCKLDILHEACVSMSEYLSYKFRIVNKVINVLDSKATNLNYQSEYNDHDVWNGNNYGQWIVWRFTVNIWWQETIKNRNQTVFVESS